MKTALAIAVLFSFSVIGCDSTSNSDQGDGLSLRMQMAPEVATSPTSVLQNQELTIAGANGTLTLSQISLIVAEFELELAEDTCDDDQEGEQENDMCEEFELPPSFINLPLDQGAVSIGTDQVAPGLYEELEFEVEDLEDDEENSQEILQLLDTIRSDYPEWPQEASMRLMGEFTPTDGTPQPFIVYAEAEIEVEMEFNPPLSVESSDQDQTITIAINPENWFIRPNGDVMDLSVFDFEQSTDLLEFEVEMENGFSSIEFDD